MSIDEAIALLKIEKECINRADDCNRKCNECDLVQDTHKLLDLYEQLAEWLKELKTLRHGANKWRKAGYAHGHSVGYNKAIDDCISIVREEVSFPVRIIERLEKLKEENK